MLRGIGRYSCERLWLCEWYSNKLKKVHFISLTILIFNMYRLRDKKQIIIISDMAGPNGQRLFSLEVRGTVNSSHEDG